MEVLDVSRQRIEIRKEFYRAHSIGSNVDLQITDIWPLLYSLNSEIQVWFPSLYRHIWPYYGSRYYMETI
jgi:hypothetical protein